MSTPHAKNAETPAARRTVNVDKEENASATPRRAEPSGSFVRSTAAPTAQPTQMALARARARGTADSTAKSTAERTELVDLMVPACARAIGTVGDTVRSTVERMAQSERAIGAARA